MSKPERIYNTHGAQRQDQDTSQQSQDTQRQGQDSQRQGQDSQQQDSSTTTFEEMLTVQTPPKKLEESLEHTAFVVDQHSKGPGVDCHTFTEGLEKLKTSGLVVFTGPTASGKTWHGLEILNRARHGEIFSTACKVLKLENTSQLENIPKQSETLVVFLDDAFGMYNISKASFRQNVHKLDKHVCRLQKALIKVVISVPSNIFIRFQNEIEESVIFHNENVVEISPSQAWCLVSDKRNALETFFRYYNITVVEDDDLENVYTDVIYDADTRVTVSSKTLDMMSQTYPSVGFLQCCLLFIRQRAFTRRGVEFFTDPVFFLIEELNNLAVSDLEVERLAFSVMAYMVLNGGTIRDDAIKTSSLFAIAREFSIKNISDRDMLNALDILSDVYIKRKSGRIEFIDKIVLEVVLQIFGDMFPCRLLSACRIDVLCHYLVTDVIITDSDDTNVFVISGNVWMEWIKRALVEIRLGNSIQILSQQTMYDNHFATVFLDELLVSDHKAFFEEVFRAACQVDNYLIVRHMLRFIRKTRCRQTNGLNLQASLVLQGFIMAAQMDSYNVVRVILDQYLPLTYNRLVKALHEACHMGNYKTVGAILTQKSHTSINDISMALFKACRCQGRPFGRHGANVCRLILRNRKDLRINQVLKSFREACRRGRTDTVNVFLLERLDLSNEHAGLGLIDAAQSARDHSGGNILKCVQTILLNRTDVNSDIVSQALVYACGTYRPDVVQLFFDLRHDIDNETVIRGLLKASNKGQCDVIKVINECRPEIQAERIKPCFIESCRAGNCETCNTLLHIWPGVKECLSEGLHEACRLGQDRIVRNILQRNAMSTANVTDALIQACQWGRFSTVDVILKECNDMTPSDISAGIAIACLHGNADVVKIIFKRKPDITKDDLTKFLSESRNMQNKYVWIGKCLDIMLKQRSCNFE